ncbi:23333_t:CDS:2 [Gigaspora rosea]|nr:23333_t:CDS:2 [Gigaspora rosea]
MNLIPLQISTDNNDNTQQHCKGCQKDRFCSLFISNNQNDRTCNIFHNLYDHIMEFIEPLEGEKTVEDQENQKLLKLEFSCTVNISMLEDNTNNLKFELYVVHVQIDGSRYPLAYLFLENNGNCNNRIHTGVLVDFFSKLYLLGLNPEFFLTDKNFSQISAARFVWKNIKVQLCLWHIKRAIENRLSNNTKPKQINYNSQMAHNQFYFIDPEFRPQLNIANYVFCPKQFRQYLTSQQIWTMTVQEVYNFCQQHLLTYLSTLENIEVRFFVQIFSSTFGSSDWRKAFKKEWKKLEFNMIQNTYFTDITNWVCGFYRYHQYLFLGTSSTQTSNFESISYNTMNSEVIENIEFIENAEVTENSKYIQVSEKMCIRLINSTKKALEILEDQQNKKNFR